jgi:hypothetical protein
VKLNPDMISYDTSIGTQGIVVLDITVAEFGKRSKPDEKRPTSYEEGPWLYQRNGRYYLFFVGDPIPEHLAYSTGSSPVGPWKYGGIVMKPQSAFTIISDGDFIKVRNVDFTGKDAARFMACVASATDDAAIELRLDSETGPIIGTLKVKSTGGADKWETQSCELSGAKGVHDLVLKFTSGSKPALNFDWWKCYQ